ncbi:uncharacterized protein LOC124453988 [Xenia sp. Carnegie-2017]|uniref:uncharacterized protein LOC124453988 n=1 Tax=Xenia sp. Carnegie-2017 TaxID=2897299 RepID=UPI001F04F6CD|nr:uncharacterized protein LOC124453988 [Xenia sp. Carnegie-2017]
MFNLKRHGKIKNDKIMRWRLELSMYDFDIVYRTGEENIPADTLSRVKVMSLTLDKLFELHKALCHPGVSRMSHFVKSRNLPFSIEEIKRMTESCRDCRECKPQYYRPAQSHLIKATQPFERLNLDFKGPLPSTDKKRYILTIIDEYSRFPFAFPCEDVSARTIVACLSELFSVFGMPTYIHSDRGSGFMSAELKSFLLQKGISSSRTTSYNPAGNGQVEKFNGTLWKTVCLALRSKNLPINHWQEVMLDALHSSLLCTATNATPHERLFSFQSKSTSGVSVPSWLATPGKVLLKRQARNSKFEPLVDEVHLIQANPQYALRIRISRWYNNFCRSNRSSRHYNTSHRRRKDRDIYANGRTLVDFSDEEGYGKYLDLHEPYDKYMNIKGIEGSKDLMMFGELHLNFVKRIDYLAYLETFDRLFDIPKEKKTHEYKRYIIVLLDYLYYYCQRVQPLVDLDKEMEETQEEFDRNWAQG